jgi:uncharacterized protein (DUF488 family)
LNGIYTIGHSTHEIETFLMLLSKSSITAIADVRSAPYSRRHPQFNREPLHKNLESCGIRYVFMGAEIGGRGSDESMYDDQGRVSYASIAESSSFNEGIKRILVGSERMTIALMCAEKDPLCCHRGILISRHLVACGVPVLHIHADARIESHRDAEKRLCHLFGLHEPDMFRTDDQILAEAYERQEARIAYVSPTNRDWDKASLQ